MRRNIRKGVTLTEVLVAIFVCGLGLMALMTLFPLGAMNMAQALKDDRCGHCAANASSILRAFWRCSLEGGTPNADDPTGPLRQLENDLRNGPVYLDPLGSCMFSGNPTLPGGIPRRNFGPNNYVQAVRWCSFVDDIDFEPNAMPHLLGGSEISRQARYSWAWMVRWMGSTTHADKIPDPQRSRLRALEYSVVVYHNRPQTQSLSGVPVGETPYTGTFDPENQRIVIPGKTSIKKGHWILDATAGAEPKGYFYRVISAKDTGGSTILTTQQPFRGWPLGGGSGTIVHMENVAEVFERSTLE